MSKTENATPIKFIVTVNRDGRPFRILTAATSAEVAEKIVMDFEGCPPSAILHTVPA